MSRFFSISLVLLLASTAAAQEAEPLVTKVKHSIAKGVAFLVSQQRDDGAWEHTDGAYKGGSTALAVLALLNCDGVIADPALELKRQQRIKRGLEAVRDIKSDTVYVRALQTMALAESRDKAYRNIIAANAQWLIDARIMRDGRFLGWYYVPRPAPANDTDAANNDASNSQYAMLALWYARQAGVPIKREVWQDIHNYYLRTQNENGSWIYSTAYGPKDKAEGSVTMTVAGLCGLLISGMELNGGREQWQPNGKVVGCGRYGDDLAIAKSLKWLNDRFTVDLEGRAYYHLYGLERAGRLSGLRFFGEHDWYREGCDAITKRQMPDGSWKAQGESYDKWPTVNTSFALLFLSKGRTPVVISKLVHGKWGLGGRDERDTDWNNDRNDLRHLTEYVSKSKVFEGKPPLAWQTYDIKRALEARLDQNQANVADEAAVVADMLQSPILYITGHNSPRHRFQGGENRLIKRYVENGGFLFAEACCGDPNFDAGIKEWVKDVWDGAELTYLESTHPVWERYAKVPAGEPYKLMGLQVGCRTVMIYSPQDLSCHWESNRTDDARSQLAFRLGTNIIAYFTAGEAPQARLTPIAVASDKAIVEPRKRGAFQIGQIYHAGDWQPAPKAMTNVLAHMQQRFGMEVMPRTERIFLYDAKGVISSKFLYMHGKKEFTVAKDHRESLRFTLENGGLLLADACCGSATFDKAFRAFIVQLFPDEKLQRIPIGPQRDVLFGKDLSGEVLSAANIKCRTKPRGQMESMEPFLEGIRVKGRWVVVYSKYDIGCALERHTSSECVGYDHASALRIATAVLRYNVRP